MTISRRRRSEAPQQLLWRILLVLIPLAGVVCLIGVLFGQNFIEASPVEPVPVNLHSVLEADYSASNVPPQLPSVRLDLIWDMIADYEPGADIASRREAVLSSLLTPVPVVTRPACEGVYVIEAARDAWVVSDSPADPHGQDTTLQLNLSGNSSSRIFLYFPVEQYIPPGAFILSARLEMNPVDLSGSAAPERVRFFNLANLFSEDNLVWSNQPATDFPYRTLVLSRDRVHAWDATDMVRDWLWGVHANTGMAVFPAEGEDFSLSYMSRETAPANVGRDTPAPRLVIDCGSPAQQGVAIASAPSPAATPAPTRIDTDTDDRRTPTVTPLVTQPLATPVPAATASPGAPSPATPAPGTPAPPTVSPPPTVPVFPTSTVAVPTPTPPTPTPVPPTAPPGGGGGDGGGTRPPTPTPTATPTSTPTATPTPTATSTPAPWSDLALSISDAPDPVIAGQTLTYTLAVTNTGPSVASGVVLTDTLPAGVTFSSAPGCSESAGVVTCNIGSLGVGSSVTRTVVVTVNAGTTGSLLNSAAVGATTADPVSGNNTAGATTTVTQQADLSISKAENLDPVSVGVPLTYTLRITNTGPATATNVTVVDTLPAGATFGSATASQGSCVQAGGTVTCTLGSLAPGPAWVTIVVTPTATGTLVNTATVTATTVDPVPGNNSATASTTVVSGGGCSAPDPVNGYVTSITPPDLATGVPVSPTIVIRFNQAMNAATLTNADKFHLGLCTASDCNTLVPTTLTITNTTFTADTAILKPVSPLAVNTTYWVTAGNAVENSCGTKQGLSVKTQFTTGYTLAINDVTVTEGDSGTTNAVFTVTLSPASAQTVTVNYSTADNTATTADNDYVAASGVLTFAPGVTTQPITVTVNGDVKSESTETFRVLLSSPTNATIADGEGIGTILQDVGGLAVPGGSHRIFLPLVIKAAPASTAGAGLPVPPPRRMPPLSAPTPTAVVQPETTGVHRIYLPLIIRQP